MIQDLPNLKEQLEQANPYTEVGWVQEVIGLIIESKGPRAKLGDFCYIHSPDASVPPLPAEVVGFKADRLLLMPIGDMTALGSGSRVVNTGHAFMTPIGDGLLGRVVDGLGQPIDQKGPIIASGYAPIMADAPPALGRRRITESLSLGVRAIDGFTTLGRGQRVGIFSGSGVGKSTTLGMISRNTEADINVIALVGERGREVLEFIEESLGEEGLKRSVVVVATSEQSALMKIKAGLTATTIAEHYRAQGKNVLLMVDSLTRVAMALREVGLAVGEPPTSRGYTPSVFAFLPKLLERSGTDEQGSITGLYTVLVEGDDFNEPISDAVRGLLDGHIILSRDLAYQNHFPAMDVLGSISRLMIQVASPEHSKAAGIIRDLMATYKKSEDIINIGAYARGTNAKLDQAIALKDTIDSFLKQSVSESVSFDDTLKGLAEIVKKIKI